MKTYNLRCVLLSCVAVACLLPAACTLRPADLSVVSVSGPPGSVMATRTWKLGCVVANSGNASAPATTVRFHYSADAVLDAGDPEIGSANVSPLAPSASVAITYSDSYAVAASGGTAGTRYVFAVVDPSAMIEDGDRSNNTRSLPVKVRYERLVIETYKPTGGDQGGTTDTIIRLRDALGVQLAWDDDSGTYFSASRIDYSDTDGFAPGSTLYLEVTGKTAVIFGPYAVRLLTDIEALDAWFYTENNDLDSPYEPDDATTAGVPDPPHVTLTVGERHNRHLGADDTDWFRLVLP